ncbi:MAG: hypothetical protein GH143_05880 [Calditrichaeota bacterium]|nr:hypothetical protein [Calditrichota bacterium]
MDNTSVVEALKAHRGEPAQTGDPVPFPNGLYQPSGRLKEQMLKTITPTGEIREHRMAEIDFADIKIFADELDIALQLQNPLVQSLFAKNAVGLANLIRVVNTESASGFKGTNGSGRQLDALLLRAEQFGDPDLTTVGAPAFQLPRTSWIRAIAGALSLQFIIASDLLGVNVHDPLAMGTTEGLAILGFANPAAAPCVDALQITYLAQAYNVQNLDFELANPFIGDAICELKQPLFVYPREQARIDARYYKVGLDELRPIGLWVKMAQNLRLLASS